MADKDRQTNGGGDAGGGGGDEDEDSGVGPTEIGDPKERECRKAKRVGFLWVQERQEEIAPKEEEENQFCKFRVLGQKGESPTSDPNSSEFTVDMLRALIEKNDFYSKECNPHLDTDSN
ncbi:Uncharacterized protein Adt_17366 [Abeliophyllum distichum]|uniref:Uncharacterized protein n=1 Tax=Abeliophyllum distichum TaxID=126358 RepID=A0ABD1TGA2_9LAMI